jgi:hypothetical protein
LGELHGPQSAPSRRHSNDEAASGLVNRKVAPVDAVESEGPEVIEVSGAVASTWKVRARLRPLLPASSTCSARAVQVPSASGVEGSANQDPSSATLAVAVAVGEPDALEPS